MNIIWNTVEHYSCLLLPSPIKSFNIYSTVFFSLSISFRLAFIEKKMCFFLSLALRNNSPCHFAMNKYLDFFFCLFYFRTLFYLTFHFHFGYFIYFFTLNYWRFSVETVKNGNSILLLLENSIFPQILFSFSVAIFHSFSCSCEFIPSNNNGEQFVSESFIFWKNHEKKKLYNTKKKKISNYWYFKRFICGVTQNPFMKPMIFEKKNWQKSVIKCVKLSIHNSIHNEINLIEKSFWLFFLAIGIT